MYQKPLTSQYCQLKRSMLVIDPKIVNYLDQFGSKDLMNLVLLILTLRKPKQRSPLELQIIMASMRELEFFKNLKKENITEETIRNLCLNLEYQFSSINHVVFKKGEFGNQFYIILSGKVGIYLPVEKHDGQYQDDLVNQLYDGQSFGELSLISEAPRTATIKCLDDCHFGIINKEIFSVALKTLRENELDGKVKFLRSLQFLAKFTKRTLETLIFHFNRIQTHRGAIICHEGQTASFVYIIESGDFVLTKGFLMPRGRQSQKSKSYIDTLRQANVKKQVEIANVGKGELFGEIDCMLNGQYHFQVHCTSQVAEIYAITKKDFVSRILEHNNSKEVKVFIQSYIAEKLTYRNDRVKSIMATLLSNQQLISGVYRDQSVLKEEEQENILINKEAQSQNNYLKPRMGNILKLRAKSQQFDEKKNNQPFKFATSVLSRLEDNYIHETQQKILQKLKFTKYYTCMQNNMDPKLKREQTYNLSLLRKKRDGYQNSSANLADQIRRVHTNYGSRQVLTSNQSGIFTSDSVITRVRTNSLKLQNPFKHSKQTKLKISRTLLSDQHIQIRSQSMNID